MKAFPSGPPFGPQRPAWVLLCLFGFALLALTGSSPTATARTPPDRPSQEDLARLIAAERWLEAECAQEGEEWQPDSSDAASNRYFVYFPGSWRHPRPNKFGGASQLKFSVNLSEAADYTLYFRVNSPANDHNSFWVSIDDGPWAKFWKQRDQHQLSTEGFEWREVADDGSPLKLNLAKGNHTIRVAARETGTQLDKIFLTPAGRHPAGIGAQAPICPARPTSTLTGVFYADHPEPAPVVFPNPTGQTVTVRLPAERGQPRLVRIIGADGKQYAQYDAAPEDVRQFSDLPIDVQQLPAGVYYVLIDGKADQAPLRATFTKLK